MNRILVVLMLCLILVMFTGVGTAQEMVRIGIMQIVDHPALDAVRDGVMDALAEEYGYVSGETIVFDSQSAQGDIATANTIARKFISDRVDLIVSIATPTSQAAVNATTEIPIVFSAVTAPVRAGLVRELENPGGNVTGASDLTPVYRQIELINYLFPEVETIGTIYNAGEVNSVVTNDMAKEITGQLELELVEATVTTTADVALATQSLVGRVGAVYVSTDNTTVSALDTVARITKEQKIPLILADPTTVVRGALLALGFDYYQLGRQTGTIVARILQGEDPGSIPVEFAQRLVLLVNRGTMDALELNPDVFEARLKSFVNEMAKKGYSIDLQFI
ncbi:MAG TPA: ABC transporter substrate-binding protein [Atribacteraceae bacterium]|nr:ABC transporter substrate-binding protein [Atribacteraceae bacterium]